MKSNKQRRAELRFKKWKRAFKRGDFDRPEPPSNAVRCNAALVVPNNSYGTPEFVQRGYYADVSFNCVGCGKEEVWTSTQQKWWYEVAKGDTRTSANRCRNCRRRERDRKNEARRVHLEGLERKKTERSANAKSTT